MKTNTAPHLMKECLAEALLLLLRERPLESISVLDVVHKAGVNRSTYYRHFESKRDVIRYYYKSSLDECLSSLREDIALEQYFQAIFSHFLKHKQELLLLDSMSLSDLLLDEMNSRFSPTEKDPVRMLYFHYHIGGVFNSFCYWLKGGMTIAPEVLAKQSLKRLPDAFSPVLQKFPAIRVPEREGVRS